jgi:glycerophosphoryl diester phosphodiesterase
LPRAARGYLFGSDQHFLKSGWASLPLRADAVHPARDLVDAAKLRQWRKQGKLVNVWTVNDVAEAKTLAALGVDAIITDVPGKILEAVR